MRTTSIKTLLAAGAVCLMGSVLQAQSTATKAHIPFAFEVSSIVLPEGDYVFSQKTGNPVADILNRRTGKRCFVPTSYGTETGPAQHVLLFHRYGETYFLSEIRNGSPNGSKIEPSKREKELMRSPKGREMASISVTLLAE